MSWCCFPDLDDRVARFSKPNYHHVDDNDGYDDDVHDDNDDDDGYDDVYDDGYDDEDDDECRPLRAC